MKVGPSPRGTSTTNESTPRSLFQFVLEWFRSNQQEAEKRGKRRSREFSARMRHLMSSQTTTASGQMNAVGPCSEGIGRTISGRFAKRASGQTR